MSRKFITNGHQRTVDDRGRVLRRVTSATGLAGVSRDAASGIYVPASAGEWTTFLAANALSGLGNPNSLWLCQEASAANLADSIGSLTLTSAATPLYQQAVAGWTRLGVSATVGSSQRFAAAAAVGPNPTTTSQLWIWFGKVDATPAGTRTWGGISDTGATQYQAICTLTPRLGNTVVNVTVSGASDPTAVGVQPMCFNYDRTGSRANIYSGQEKVVGTYNAGVLDGRKGILANGATALASTFVYGYMYSGAPGEMSDANLKLLLQAHGFSVAWT